MLSLRGAALVGVVLSAVAALAVRAAYACSVISPVSVFTGPFDGEVGVPTNARIDVTLAGLGLGAAATEAANFELQRVESNGSTTSVATTTVVLANVVPDRIELELRPASPLTPNAKYRVVDKTGKAGVHEFETGSAASDAAAIAPGSVNASVYSVRSCSNVMNGYVEFDFADASDGQSFRFEEADGAVLCASTRGLSAVVVCHAGVPDYLDLGVAWPLTPGRHTLAVRSVTRTGELSSPVQISVNVDCAHLPDASPPVPPWDASTTEAAADAAAPDVAPVVDATPPQSNAPAASETNATLPSPESPRAAPSASSNSGGCAAAGRRSGPREFLSASLLALGAFVAAAIRRRPRRHR